MSSQAVDSKLLELMQNSPSEITPALQAKLDKAARILRQIQDGSEIPSGEIFGGKLVSKLLFINSKLADHLFRFNVAEFQRNVTDSRLKDLMYKIQDGRFHGNKIALAYFQKRLILMNGQHTLLAILQTQETVENWVEVVRCDTEAQLACYWAQFDEDGKRSPKQQCAAFGVALSETLGGTWDKDMTQVLSIACSLIRYGTTAKGTAGTLQDRTQLIPKYEPHSSIARDIIFGHSFTKQLRRGPVAHAVLLTVMADADDARKFWGGVVDGTFTRQAQPEKVLREYLLETKQSNTGKRSESNQDMTGKCLEAWNYFRDHQDVPSRGRGRAEKKPMLTYKDTYELPEAQ